MADHRTRSPSSGLEFIIAGAVLGLIGIGILLDSDVAGGTRLVGLGLAWLGGIFTTIGVVAVGVTVGFRRADWIIRDLGTRD